MSEIVLEGTLGICYCPVSMSPITVYRKNPDFVQRDVAGECILVPIRRTLPQANSIYVLNDTGSDFWNRIDGSRSLQEITAGFAEEYDVAVEQLSQDLETLLADLLSIRAIEKVAFADDPSR